MKQWTKLLSIPMTLSLLAACGDTADDTADQTQTETVETTETADTDTDTGTDTDTDTETDTDTDTDEDTDEDSDEAEETDATSGATQVVSSEEEVQEAIGPNGAWLVLFEDDVEANADLVMAGGVTNNDGEEMRKFGLYETDDDGEVVETYTLTAPTVTTEQEHTRVVHGTIAADFIVDAPEFQLEEGTIDGDLIFTSEEYEQSANLDGEVTGEVRVDEEAE